MKFTSSLQHHSQVLQGMSKCELCYKGNSRTFYIFKGLHDDYIKNLKLGTCITMQKKA
jgi:hypothetical protein